MPLLELLELDLSMISIARGLIGKNGLTKGVKEWIGAECQNISERKRKEKEGVGGEDMSCGRRC